MPDRLYDLRYLRYAIVAGEQKSFRRAAIILGVPQSEVSRRIRTLEDRLGFDLFRRGHSGSFLTLAGERFLLEAQSGIERLAHAAKVAAGTRQGEDGELRIGILASLSSGFLRHLLQQYSSRHKGVRTILEQGAPDDHIGRLMTGSIDVAFIAGEPTVRGCRSERLWTERIAVVLPVGHYLSPHKRIRWSRLRNEKFIVSKGGPGREIANHLIKNLAYFGFSPDITTHDLSREDLAHLVSLGYGLTLTSESACGTPIPGTVFRQLADEVDLPSSAVWVNSNRNPALQRLLKAARALSNKWAIRQHPQNCSELRESITSN